MAQELGRIEKPAVEQYRTARKLFFVPLVFAPGGTEPELAEKVDRYWAQVEDQVTNLETKLGSVSKVYHELVPLDGEAGARAIEELNKGSHRVVKSRLERGAHLQPIEGNELLAEFMDWSRCLSMGLQSQTAATRVYEFYSEAQKRRNEDIAKRIDETLQSGEIGVLLMGEGHRVQFPLDIQVFYVAPPCLEEIKRWLRDREAQLQKKGAGEGQAS